MEVQVGREDGEGEVVDPLGKASGNVAIAQVFAYHRAVLALGQGVVVGLAGARLGEFLDVELVEQFGDAMVDVLGAVVAVEAVDGEGEGLDEVLQDGEEEALADALDGADKLELGDFVDGVDEVEALDAVQVALVHGVDAQPVGAAAGTRLAPLANGVAQRAGLVLDGAQALIAGALAQVVEVAVGDSGQALVTGLAEHLERTLGELACGRTGERAVQTVQFGQQRCTSSSV